MKKTLAGLLAAITIAATLTATTTDASAWWRGGRGWGWRGGGWGWGPGIAAGAVTGAVVAGAIIATRPRGYVMYPGYAVPVAGPGCYWASRPMYDGWGRVVGFAGQPVQVCPGYAAGPPAAPYVEPPQAAPLPQK
jgi:hypothetical protein